MNKIEYTPAQLACIDDHRDINTDHEWWECTYEDFASLTEEVGISASTKDVQFSGFWSQGDGASFTFSSFSLATMLEKCEKFLDQHNGRDEDTRTGLESQTLYAAFLSFASQIVDTFQKYRLCGDNFMDEVMGEVKMVATRESYHYSHSRTVRASWDTHPVVDEDSPMYAMAQCLIEDLDDAWADGAVEDLANALYSTLEEEYECLTSDEAVWDAIEANDLFEEDEEDEQCAA